MYFDRAHLLLLDKGSNNGAIGDELQRLGGTAAKLPLVNDLLKLQKRIPYFIL